MADSDSAPAAASVPFYFALTPFDVYPEKVIDYSTEWGLEFWKLATEPLRFEYDGSPDKLDVFLTLVRHEIEDRCWHAINEVVDRSMSPGGETTTTTHCWIDKHDEYTVDALRQGLNSDLYGPTRHAQNSCLMYHFLRHSLDSSFFCRVSDCQDLYTVHGRAIGPLFLKVILSLVAEDAEFDTSRAQVVLSLPRRRFAGANSTRGGRRRRR